jgi:hypothetical protein
MKTYLNNPRVMPRRDGSQIPAAGNGFVTRFTVATLRVADANCVTPFQPPVPLRKYSTLSR